MKNCAYVLRPAEPGRPAVYCEKPTPFHYVKDDDGNLRRQHDTFCKEHQAKVSSMPDDESELP